jgi:tRNA(Ile)-lysidine synthase
MPDTLDIAEYASRFATAIASLTNNAGNPSNIGFAVSGGPDSMAMLSLAQQHFGSGVKAATVDHRLRAAAADEARFVHDFCSANGIAHAILNVDTAITGNVQAAARVARYALLEQWADAHGIEWIATAHHADDQLETLLMRVARGAGISGLSGVRARNQRIIRPLLAFTKAELEAICADAGITPCRDPSNSNADFDRVRMRQWLGRTDSPFEPLAAVRSATALAEAGDALEWAAQRLVDERVTFDGENRTQIDPDGIPAELQRRLLLLALAQIDDSLAPRGALIDRALSTLRDGGKIMVGNIMCTGGRYWQLSPAPPRKT